MEREQRRPWRAALLLPVAALALAWGSGVGCPDGDLDGSTDEFSSTEIEAVNGALNAAPEALVAGAESLVEQTLAAARGASFAARDQPLTCISGTGSLHLEYDVTSVPCDTGNVYTLTGTATTTFNNCGRPACDTTGVQNGTNSGPFVLTFDQCANTGSFVGTNITTGSGCSDTSTMTVQIGAGTPLPVGYSLDITIGLPGFTVDSVSGTVCTDTGPCAASGGCAFSGFDNLFSVIDPTDTCLLTATSCREYYLDPATQTDPDPAIDASNKDFCLNQGLKQEGNCCVASSQCGGVVDGSGNPVAGACCPWAGGPATCAGRESCECFAAPAP